MEAGLYPVEFRDDARQLISIDDVLSQHLDIGGEEDKEITDPPPMLLTPEFIAATERGNVLHAVLSRVRVLDDLAGAVERECKRRSVGQSTADEYLADLRKAFDEAGRLWQAGSTRIVGSFPNGRFTGPMTTRLFVPTVW